MNIIDRLREAGVLGRALGDLLGLDGPARPGKAVRCVYPDRHKHGDANPSLVIARNGAGATCKACGFGGGLLDIARDRLCLPDRRSAAAELERLYLGGASQQFKAGQPTGPAQATYAYEDEEGGPLYETLRFPCVDAEGKPSKTFRVRRPDPKQAGGWIWDVKETRLVLFRLPPVRKAIEAGETIHIAEGEKDVLALEAAGVTATCNPFGAGKWRPEFTEMLRGAKKVVVVADKDVPGYRHAHQVAAALSPVVGEVAVVEAREGKDAADHLAAGHGVGDFVPAQPPKESTKNRERDGGTRPTISVVPDVPLIVDQAERALLAHADVEMYQRYGQLVRVIRDGAPKAKGFSRPPRAPLIAVVPEGFLLEQMSRAAEWVMETRNGVRPVLPPRWALQVLVARALWRFPWLEAVVEAPAFCADGSIVETPGHDPASGLLYIPNAKYPAVPEHPSEADVRAALDTLMVPFAEFPFVSDVDRAATLASILTVVARHAIFGPCPLFAVTAPTPGTGKTLLVLASVLLGTGRLPTLMAADYENEEFRKVITTIALEGHRAILFDNAEGSFGSPILAGALTATEYSGRILGLSRTVNAPLLVVWYVTGNNLFFNGDTYRRIVPIRLDAKLEQPEDREFARPELLMHIARERASLHVAALTLLRGFHEAGRPQHGGSRMGSFEVWDDLIRSAVVWLLDVDPCEGRRCLREEDDTDWETVRELVHAIDAAFPKGRAATVGDMIRKAEQDEELRDALAALDRRREEGPLDPKVIGYALRKYKNRVVDGLRLERADAVRQGVLWRIVRVEPAAPTAGTQKEGTAAGSAGDGAACGDGDDGGDGSGRSSAGRGESPSFAPGESDGDDGTASGTGREHDRDHRHHRTEEGVRCGDGDDRGDRPGRSETGEAAGRRSAPGETGGPDASTGKGPKHRRGHRHRREAQGPGYSTVDPEVFRDQSSEPRPPENQPRFWE